MQWLAVVIQIKSCRNHDWFKSKDCRSAKYYNNWLRKSFFGSLSDPPVGFNFEPFTPLVWMIVTACLHFASPQPPRGTHSCSPHSNQSDHCINRSQTRLLLCSAHCWDFPSTQNRSQNPYDSHMLFPRPKILFSQIPAWSSPSLHSGLSANTPTKERLFLIPKMVPHPIIVYITYIFLFFCSTA